MGYGFMMEGSVGLSRIMGYKILIYILAFGICYLLYLIINKLDKDGKLKRREEKIKW